MILDFLVGLVATPVLAVVALLPTAGTEFGGVIEKFQLLISTGLALDTHFPVHEALFAASIVIAAQGVVTAYVMAMWGVRKIPFVAIR